HHALWRERAIGGDFSGHMIPAVDPEQSSADAGEGTELLGAWRAGDPSAFDRLLPLIYRELHAIAARARRRESPGATLQTTALVHEAYLRLVHQDRAHW